MTAMIIPRTAPGGPPGGSPKKNTKISVDEGFFGPPLEMAAPAGAPGAAPAGKGQPGQQPPQPATGGNPK